MQDQGLIHESNQAQRPRVSQPVAETSWEPQREGGTVDLAQRACKDRILSWQTQRCSTQLSRMDLLLPEELPQLRSPCHLGPHPCRAAHTRWYKAWPLWPPGGWVMLAPKLPPSLAEALWHLHRDWTSPSAWGCFCPFLSQVFIPSHHLVLRMRVTSICSQTPQPVTVSGCACVKSCVGEGCKAVAWASPSKCSSRGET